jgi:hypothetical protein
MTRTAITTDSKWHKCLKRCKGHSLDHDASSEDRQQDWFGCTTSYMQNRLKNEPMQTTLILSIFVAATLLLSLKA